MGHAKELVVFECGAVIRFHCYQYFIIIFSPFYTFQDQLIIISKMEVFMNHINSPTKWHTIYCKVTGLESCQIPADSINAELQIFYGINIRIKTVHHKLHKVGFHARTAPVDACIFSIHVLNINSLNAIRKITYIFLCQCSSKREIASKL